MSSEATRTPATPERPEPPAERAGRARTIGLVVALGALVAVSYANAMRGGFVFDDLSMVRDSPCTSDASALAQGFVPWEGGPCGYRVVRHLSYFVDTAVFGPEPWGYHLSSVLLHGMVVLLVFAFARSLGLNPIGSFLAAALFAVHPVHTEAVTYITGRKDVLVTLFALAALLAFLRWRRSGRTRDLLLAAVPLALAFGSKESAAVVPAVAVLAAALGLPGPAGTDLRAWLRGLPRPVWIVAGLVGAATLAYVILRGFLYTKTTGDLWGGSVATHSATAASLQLRAVGVLLWPETLLGDYNPAAWPIRTWASPYAWAGLLTVLTLGAVSWGLRRRSPRASFLLGAYLLAIAPASQIIPHHELFGERNLYLPSVFLCLGAGWLLALGWEHVRSRPPGTPRTALVAAGGLVLAGLIGGGVLRTVDRNGDYHDEETFWLSVLEDAPDSVRALGNLASVELEKKRWPEALGLARRAMHVRERLGAPRDPTLDIRAGVALFKLGRVDEAVGRLDTGLQGVPDDLPGLWYRGEAARALRDPATSLAMGRRLVEAHPARALGWRLVADALLTMGRPDEAAAELREALRRFPQDGQLIEMAELAGRAARSGER